MAAFIPLTIDNTNETENVNVDHIIEIYRRPNISYTVVEFTNGKTITVKERPADILAEIEARG